MLHLAENIPADALLSVPVFINLPLVTDEDIERAEQQEHSA